MVAKQVKHVYKKLLDVFFFLRRCFTRPVRFARLELVFLAKGSCIWLMVENGFQIYITVRRNGSPEFVTTQMKALDEYILTVLFVLVLKRVHFLANET